MLYMRERKMGKYPHLFTGRVKSRAHDFYAVRRTMYGSTYINVPHECVAGTLSWEFCADFTGAKSLVDDDSQRTKCRSPVRRVSG